MDHLPHADGDIKVETGDDKNLESNWSLLLGLSKNLSRDYLQALLFTLSLGKKQRPLPICPIPLPKCHNHPCEGITLHYGAIECITKELVVSLHECLREKFSLRNSSSAAIIGATSPQQPSEVPFMFLDFSILLCLRETKH